MEFNNEFVIRGKILKIDKERSSIRLFSKSGKKETFPLVLVSRQLLESCNLNIQMHVTVRGGVVSKYQRNKSGNYVRRQYFVATSIEPDKTMCGDVFDVKGTFSNEFKALCYLSGEFVSESIRDDGWMSLILQVSPAYRDVVKVQMRMLKNQPKFEKGDPVYIVGTISTVNKNFGEKKMHYENIVVNDIGTPGGDKSKKTNVVNKK